MSRRSMKTPGGTYSDVLRRTLSKQTRGIERLYLNPEIGFGCTCVKNDFSSIRSPSFYHEEMVLFKSSSVSTTTLINLTYLVSII